MWMCQLTERGKAVDIVAASADGERKGGGHCGCVSRRREIRRWTLWLCQLTEKGNTVEIVAVSADEER